MCTCRESDVKIILYTQKNGMKCWYFTPHSMYLKFIFLYLQTQNQDIIILYQFFNKEKWNYWPLYLKSEKCFKKTDLMLKVFIGTLVYVCVIDIVV